MARAIWKGAISFGMVIIPVKMYSATEIRDLSFSMLHRPCLTRLKQVRYCPSCDEHIEWQDVVRGYEYSKGHYVVLEDKDFEKVPLKTMHTIEISGFVRAGEVDPVYYQRSCYLQPEELGAKPFF
jgi:DNA end-binding protein Ku